MPVTTSNDSGVSGVVKGVTTAVGNTVSGVSNTVGGTVGAVGRGLGEVVTGVTGGLGKPVGTLLAEGGTGVQVGAEAVAKGARDAGKWK